MKNYKILTNWVALVLILSLTSCAKSVVYWNQATELFDQAAEMETVNRFADRLGVEADNIPPEALPGIDNLFSMTDTPPPAGDPAFLYQQADEKISQAILAPAPLKKEDKLANALTLKALTSWKTGQADDARLNAAKAIQEFSQQQEPSPRDEPLAKAVPGLVALDLAYDGTHSFIQDLKDKAEGAPDRSQEENKQIIAEGRRLYGEFVADESNDHSIAGAQTDLEAAMMRAGNNKEVQVFLQLCEMTGLKNRYDFIAQIDNYAKRSGLKASDAELREWIDSERESYLDDKDAALEKLEDLLDGGSRNKAYRFWDNLL